MEIHKSDKIKLTKALNHFLSSIEVKDSKISYKNLRLDTPEIDSILLKDKTIKINKKEIFPIINEQIYEILPVIDESTFDQEKFSGSFESFIGGKDNLHALTENIIAFFESLPREYLIKIKFPSIKHSSFELLELTNAIKFQYETIPPPFTPYLPFLSNSSKETFLNISLKGYIDYSTNTSTWNEAHSILEKLIILGIYFGIFSINKFDYPMNSFLEQALTHKKQVSFEKVYVLDIKNTKSKYIDISHDSSLLAYQTVLSEKANSDINFLNTNLIRLKEAIVLLQKNDDYTKKVNTAITWAFASEASNNQTFAYLFTFLGLEALFGFNNSKESALVDKLAIRCSALIASGQKQRKELYDRFIELYQIRSNLVHGTVAQLDSENEENLIYAQYMLRIAISKEINLLKYND